MIRALALERAHAITLEAAARAARPLEYCAALLGRVESDVAVVTDVVRLRNCDTAPGRFSVADSEIRRAHLLARERGTEVLGIAHSHPSRPAEPSPRDREGISRSRYAWLIAGFKEDGRLDIAAFEGGTAAAIPVFLDPADPPVAGVVPTCRLSRPGHGPPDGG